jgi:hypothetical protein
MVADRPYGEIYDFYSVSLEYFGYTLVLAWKAVAFIWNQGDRSCTIPAHHHNRFLLMSVIFAEFS